MRLVLQRVSQASVSVNSDLIAQIGLGLVILVGVCHGDTSGQADWLAQKVANLRIFDDAQGKMNRSCIEIVGEVLVVSQFTLYADAQKGRRPSYIVAAPPEMAEPLVNYFAQRLEALGLKVKNGQFGAKMMVEIHNNGPVTIILEQ